MRENIIMMLISYSTIMTFISYIPQIIQLYKTKKSDDISDSSWIMFSSNGVAYAMATFLMGDILIIIPAALEALLNIIILCLSMWYKRNVGGVR